jgi:hypothetical protein
MLGEASFPSEGRGMIPGSGLLTSSGRKILKRSEIASGASIPEPFKPSFALCWSRPIICNKPVPASLPVFPLPELGTSSKHSTYVLKNC